MEAHAGGDVDIEIGMVHPVQPPQHRHFVEDDVLRVDDEIERQEADQRGDREPQLEIVDQAPAVAGRRYSAAPTAAVGTSTRTVRMSTTRIPRLPGQRRPRPTAQRPPRRQSSHSAKAQKNTTNAPSRMTISTVMLPICSI